VRSDFKQNLIISIIGFIGIIIGALIGIVPNYSKNKNEFTVKIEQVESRKETELSKLSMLNPKVGTKEDGYISSIIDGISNIIETTKVVHIESVNNKQGEMIRTQSEYRLSNNLFIRRIVQVEKSILVGEKKYLMITPDLGDIFEENIFEVNEGLLTSNTKQISFFELEHYLNNAGIYVIKSTIISNDSRSNIVETKLRYEFEDKNRKRIIEAIGHGLYYY